METTRLIYNKSKEAFKKGEQYWIHYIDFLKQISNVKVFAFIVVSLEQITFNILSGANSDNLLFRHIYKLNSYTENSIKPFVNLIKKIVASLEFNKLIGIFDSKIIKIPKPLFFDEFGIEYINKNSCIICSDQTISKLKCKHFCCISCFDVNSTTFDCDDCKQKSSGTTNQFQYYSIDPDELKFVKHWFKSNNFSINLNQTTNFSNGVHRHNYSDDSYYSEEEIWINLDNNSSNVSSNQIVANTNNHVGYDSNGSIESDESDETYDT